MNKKSDQGHPITLVSVCIATYKREALLEKLLESLVRQLIPENMSLELVVVDNDGGGSAEKVVRKHIDSEKMNFKYFVQPEKNISLTRNDCVANATGDYICFIDDDEIASENWITRLYEALSAFNADGVFGYVEPIFDENIADNFKKREYYFSTVDKTGSTAKFYFTTNALIKAELLKNEKIPFHPGYGLTGGEDVHLFERLADKGAKFINCKEAITYEIIPISRATSRYLYNRALRGGQSFARRTLEKNEKLSLKLIILSKAIIMIMYSTFFYLLDLFSKHNRLLRLQNIGASVGKIRSLLGTYKNLY
ncbi:MAG: glycosyltransferase [Ignavibacteria bacterium]|nr:glycosyltransferase [Ignavibacteria bacterium]